MTLLKEIKKELAERNKLDNLSKKNVIALQRAYVKDHPKCERCGNTNNLSYDHIIPKIILSDFNIDINKDFWEENSQTLCVACNIIKSGHLDFSNPKTKPLLLTLLK